MWCSESECRCKILSMKIAIVKLSALGDIVHAMVVLQFIKKHNSEIEVDWVVEECYKGLVEFNPHISKIHVVNIKKAKKNKSLFLLYKELRRIRQFGPYDIVVDMQSLTKSAIISCLIPSRLSVGFDKSSARESLASIFYNKTFKYGYSENVIERNLAIISFALGLNANVQEINHKHPFLYVNQKYSDKNISQNKKNIILIPGSSDKSKCYPISSLARLTTLIDANFLVIWGNSQEKVMAEQIKIQSPTINICKKLSIESLISLISQVELVIGPDTGPTHMAWALNIASITIFGPTPGYRNTYETKINKIIESESRVNPFKINKNDMSISEIKVKNIVSIANKLIEKI